MISIARYFYFKVKIMKQLKYILVPVLLLVLAGVAQAQPKIGIIDMTKVFDNYYKTKAAKTTLKDYVGELDKEGQALMDELKKANDEYKKALEDSNNQAVSSKEREKSKTLAEAKFKEAQEKQQTIEMFKRRADAQVSEKRRQMFEKIMEEIKTVINSQAKAGAFTLVVDSTSETAGGTPLVLYNNGENDLTATVLTQLNLLSGSGGEKKAQ